MSEASDACGPGDRRSGWAGAAIGTAFRRISLLAAAIGMVAAATIGPTSPALAAPTSMGGMSVAKNADGRLEVFSLGSDTRMYHNYQRPSGGWSGWISLGAPSGGLWQGPAVGMNRDGRLEIFATSTNALYHAWQQAGTSTGWSGWAKLGDLNSPGTPSVVSNLDGRLEVFVTAATGVWSAWQLTPNGGWSGLYFHGGVIADGVSVMSGSITAARNADGRLEVFVVTTLNWLYHRWQSSPGGGWSTWQSMGVCRPTGVRGPQVAANADGRLEVFVLSPFFSENNAFLCHRWQTSGGWSGWLEDQSTSLDSIGGFTVGKNADGRLELYARDTNGVIWSNWQTAPNGGWSGWYARSSSGYGYPLALGLNTDGRLEAFANRNGQPYHSWQRSPGGSWSSWVPLEVG